MIGGDSDLSERGHAYSKALTEYINGQKIEGLRVWTSWLKRTIQTVASLEAPQERWKALNEIDAVRNQFVFNAFRKLKEKIASILMSVCLSVS